MLGLNNYFQIDKATNTGTEVAIGDSNKLEIFMSQRRSCESKLYLEMTNFQLIANTDYANLEPTFIFDTTEEKPIKGFIAKMDLSNPFTTNTYKIEILNNNRYFHFIDNSDQIVPDSPPRQEIDPGFGIPPYVPYEETTPPEPLPEQTTFNLNSNNIIIVLAKPLDFRLLRESRLAYKITGSLPDGSTISATGVLLFKIFDYNNNWPSPLHQVYTWDGNKVALSTDPLEVTAVDEDETVNAELEYFIGNIARPENEIFYRDVQELYLYEDVMLEYNVTVHLVDKGTPRLGRTARVNVVLSAACVTTLEFEIGLITGNFFVKAPGYYSSGNKKYCDPCEAGYYCYGYGLRARCTTCDQELLQFDGSYQVMESDSDCQRSKTEFSFGGASECIPCKDGWVCEDGMALPILDNSLYIETCSTEICPEPLPCPTGAACMFGIKEDCLPGTSGNGEKCAFCPPGRYSDEVNSSECKCCPQGFESSHKKESCIPCAFNELSYGCRQCVTCPSAEDCPCLNSNPCFPDVQCVNDPSSNDQFLCLECPEGTEGDGRVCSDINECEVDGACFESCHNMENGYECGPCPAGYYGETPSGWLKYDSRATILITVNSLFNLLCKNIVFYCFLPILIILF